jgi:predicted phosphodiesterase
MFNFNTLIRWCGVVFLVAIIAIVIKSTAAAQPFMTSVPQLLSDPFLQLPTENSVRVVWFTEFAGSGHTVSYDQDFRQQVIATTTKLSRTREDRESRVDIEYKRPTKRDIWRHEAEVTKLDSNIRLPYRVTSVREDGKSISSGEFTLAAKPKPGTPLKILLTSDHQLKPMTAANLQKVVEKVGRVDGVFFAGDLINIADRASEWFDDNRGGAFFPCLQGLAKYELSKDGVKTTYTGGEIIQHAPLYAAIGNHEVMGRFERTGSLGDEFSDSYPRQSAIAQLLKQKRDRTVKDYSFNTDTYEEIFTLPQSDRGGKKYYAVTFGDVRLVVLYATNIWRPPSLDKSAKGKYQEREQDINNPDEWGYGQHIFEDISRGSPQYNWLEAELNSSQFQEAKYKVVMLHHPPHSLGDNIVPAYTNPVQIIDTDKNGTISVRYEYPIEQDYLIRDVVPLLEAASVQLVFYGHSHLWNRFISKGINFLETSNVGNSYGAAIGEKRRDVPISNNNYQVTGDPNGLEPIVPTIAPLLGENGQKLPYLASNDITAFSIFDTATGSVSSYRFDTLKPDSEVIKFDEFNLSIK